MDIRLSAHTHHVNMHSHKVALVPPGAIVVPVDTPVSSGPSAHIGNTPLYLEAPVPEPLFGSVFALLCRPVGALALPLGSVGLGHGARMVCPNFGGPMGWGPD